MNTKTTSQPTDLKAMLQKLEDFLELYLVKKAPLALPENWKEVIVKVAPWLTLVSIVVALPLVLGVIGLGAILAPIGLLAGVTTGITALLTMVVSAVSLVLEAIALPGLFKRAKKSWYLVYYATLLASLTNVINFNLGGLVIGTLLSFYILFQVKSYYK